MDGSRQGPEPNYVARGYARAQPDVGEGADGRGLRLEAGGLRFFRRAEHGAGGRAGIRQVLRSFLARGIPFKEYYALDISERNIEYLREQFPRPDIHFMRADIEDVSLPFRFDVGFSSLTFKHLYPSFEAALRNCARNMSPGGRFIFDLVEGDQAHFVNQGRAYVRRYGREEVLEILGKTGLDLVTFDEVVHDRHYRRLLVVAAKTD